MLARLLTNMSIINVFAPLKNGNWKVFPNSHDSLSKEREIVIQFSGLLVGFNYWCDVLCQWWKRGRLHGEANAIYLWLTRLSEPTSKLEVASFLLLPPPFSIWSLGIFLMISLRLYINLSNSMADLLFKLINCNKFLVVV